MKIEEFIKQLEGSRILGRKISDRKKNIIDLLYSLTNNTWSKEEGYNIYLRSWVIPRLKSLIPELKDVELEL